MKVFNIEFDAKECLVRVDESKVTCDGKLYTQIDIRDCDAVLAMSYLNHRDTRRTVYFSQEDIEGFLRVINQIRNV